MDTKYLESSEFYDKRFRNFATLVIIPAFVLLLLTILFGVLQKEIVTKQPVRYCKQAASNDSVNQFKSSGFNCCHRRKVC